MAYIPFVWKDGSSGATPISAARLNAIEQGIAAALPASDLVLSPKPSGTDDTAAIQAWLNSNAGNAVTIRPGTYSSTGITIPANTVVMARRAKFVLASSSGNGFTLNDGSQLIGAEVDGSAVTNGNVFGVWSVQNVNRVAIQDCYVHNFLNVCIGVDHGLDFKIINNTCTNTPSNGIYVAFSNNGVVTGNILRNTNGIQVWGGDAAANPVPDFGCRKIKVDNNLLEGGGIFLAHVQDFSINNNYSNNGPDVGIDAEGCANGTMSNNVVRNAVNYGVCLFYGGNDISIVGNTVQADAGTGQRSGIAILTSVRHFGISIVGNDVTVPNYGVFTDNGSLGDSVISANKLFGSYGILLQNAYEIIVNNNRIMSGGSRGIGLEGSYDCIVSSNRVIKIGSDSGSAGANGGIWIYDRGGQYNAQRNQIQGNRIGGYVTSITLRANRNLITQNLLETIAVGSGNSSFAINANQSSSDPTVVVNATAV